MALKDETNNIAINAKPYIRSDEEIQKNLYNELAADKVNQANNAYNNASNRATSLLLKPGQSGNTTFTEQDLAGYIRSNFHNELSDSVSKLIDNSMQSLVEERLDIVNKKLKKTEIGGIYEKATNIYNQIYKSDVLLMDMKSKYTKSLQGKLSGSVSNSINKFTSNKWVGMFIDGSKLSADITSSINTMVAETINAICSNQLIVDTTREIKDTVTALKKSATSYLETQFKDQIDYGKKLKSAVKDKIALYEAKKAEYLQKITSYITDLRNKISNYLTKLTTAITAKLTEAVRSLVSGIKF